MRLYSLIIILLLGLGSPLKGQFFFSFDILPDSSLVGGNFTDPFSSSVMGLNLDADPDIELELHAGRYQFVSGTDTTWVQKIWAEGLLGTDVGVVPGPIELCGDSCESVPIAMESGDLIDGAIPFDTAGFLAYRKWSNDGGDTLEIGSWLDGAEHYLALRVPDVWNNYYVWLSLTASNSWSVSADSFAIRRESLLPIAAGWDFAPEFADRPTALTAVDTADFGDGRDLALRFERASNETRISEYRLMAIPQEDALTFTVTNANQVEAGNYLPVIPTGTDQNIIFPAAMLDTRGEPIINLQIYRLVVLSVGNAANVANSLSAPSNPVTLLPGAVIATDVDPDFVLDGCCFADLSSSNEVRIDIDQDGTDDISLQASLGETAGGLSRLEQIWIESLDSVNFASFPGSDLDGACLSDSCDWLPIAFNSGDLIDLALDFTAEAGWLNMKRNFVSGDSIQTGLWQNPGDNFVGLQLIRDGDPYLGWLELEVVSGHEVIVKSFAWNPLPFEGVLAGSIDFADPADRATNVAASDVADNGNSSDLFYSFDQAGDEIGVDEYRLMCIPIESLFSFSIAEANNVAAGNYLSITPAGINPSGTYPVGALDIYGDPIQQLQGYSLAVLSVASDSSNANSLSAPSSPVVLLPLGLVVTDPADILVDGCCFTDASVYNEVDLDIDLDGSNEIQFQVGQYELVDGSDTTRIESIWVEGADSVYVAAFEGPDCTTDSCDWMPAAFLQGDLIDQAQNFEASRGWLQYDFESPFSTLNVGVWPLNQDAYLGIYFKRDSTWHFGWVELELPSKHELIIKSFAWNAFPELGVVAGESFFPEPADRISDLVAVDIADNGNGLDLGFSFIKADDESSVSEYRVMAIPLEEIATFGITQANLTSPSNYLSFTPSGLDISSNFSAISTDIRGDLIEEWKLYSLAVLSVAGGSANTNALSAPSSPVSLTPTIGVDVATGLSVQDYGDDNSGLDAVISIEPALDETHILSYGIIAVKSSSAASFDLLAAQSLSIDRYWLEAPEGTTIETRLNEFSLDSDGDPIQNDQEYVVFAVSFPFPDETDQWGISTPSAEFILRDMRAQNIMVQDAGDIEDANDIRVRFDQIPFATGLIQYRIFIVRSDLVGDVNPFLAATLDPELYTAVAPLSSSYDIRLDLNQGEVFTGSQIFEGFNYNIFIASILVGDQFGADAISEPSENILLEDLSTGFEEDLEQGLKWWSYNGELYFELSQLWTGSKIALYDLQGRLLELHRINELRGRINLPDNSWQIAEIIHPDGYRFQLEIFAGD